MYGTIREYKITIIMYSYLIYRIIPMCTIINIINDGLHKSTLNMKSIDDLLQCMLFIYNCSEN